MLLVVAGALASPGGDARAPVPPSFPACTPAHAVKHPWLAPAVRLRYVPTRLAPPLSVGTPHPIVLAASSPDARWTAFCQARKDTDGNGHVALREGMHGSIWGDDLHLYLALDAGPGERIDDIVAGSPDGRYLAIVRHGSFRLLDTITRVERDLSALGANASNDSDPVEAHRAGSFDDAGTRFVWIRSTPCGPRVMVRTLVHGRDRELKPGDGMLHRAWIDPAGHWVLARTIPRDTNGDGRLTPHVAWTSLARGPCLGPIRSYSTFVRPGDVAEVSAAPSAAGPMTPVPGFVTVVGRYLIRRLPDGALVARTTDGAEELWVPSDCQGEVLARAIDVERVLVACRMGGAVTVQGPALHCALPLRTAYIPTGTATVEGTASVAAGGGSSARVDLAGATVVPDRGHVAAPAVRPTIWGNRLFTERGGVSDGVWLDFSEGTYAVVDARVLAVDVHGRMLRAARAEAEEPSGFAWGPLVWRRPSGALRHFADAAP
ncbi:MAG: hypothetical protein Q8S73_01575 [Deltaproteobacteria bacterium]|nr:hypothetical protein [Deltaproteobacteria bacterium]